MSTTSKTLSGRKVWTLAKAYAAVKDLPEVVPLFVIVGGALGLAAYTTRREYFTTVGEHFPDPRMRADWEKQVSYGQETQPKGWLWHVAQWKCDPESHSIDVGVWPFSNRAWKYDHANPMHPETKPGVLAEGPYPTEY